jgi:hypothetical protein
MEIEKIICIQILTLKECHLQSTGICRRVLSTTNVDFLLLSHRHAYATDLPLK